MSAASEPTPGDRPPADDTTEGLRPPTAAQGQPGGYVPPPPYHTAPGMGAVPGYPAPGQGDQSWYANQPIYQPGYATPGYPPHGAPQDQPTAWGWPPQPGAPWGPPVGPQPRPISHRIPVLVGLGCALIIVAMVAGLLVGRAVWQPTSSPTSNAGSTGNGTFPGFTGPGSNPGVGPGNQAPNAPAGPANASAIADAVSPALVDVVTQLGFQGGEAAGTGMVLTSNGVVLTNNHVIEGATAISVTDIGNGKTYTASVVGYDRSDDVAVIQLANASGLKTVSTADSSKVKVNDPILAIGNAGGVGGTPSVAGGTVTALNQAITASDESGGGSEQLTGLIQLNADVQPGDSGGPLVNADGKVVGMDTAASAGFQFQNQGNQGFAIPINQATTIANQIRGSKSSATVHIGESAFLGVEVSAGSQGGDQGGFGGNGGGGNGGGGNGGSNSNAAIVAGVVNGSPAEQAGLQEGDVITSLGGKTVDSATTLTNLMTQHHPGDKVNLGWTDTAGQSQSTTVQLATGPAF
ncbi:trypsin-like peptidase domain-containing protein [Rugosimonospora acidiphila]|uniref:Trypsin-like peptidase domain-containing protein n=1 Tax=Rugosimonospora acidiphila TaxID=556531 RepID=A0ABP9RMK0_9ACTN